eukprot:TRINITY_DN11086_c0_g1_i1.p1 TRINITY_DN11086_c0_g1~~TRINITY_DN11086_c0_g1_i1.p1  ORF type:complete len:633 (-),score=132.01 TRINITY_DN11086_c0_g1_i1:423-2321(-)
MGEVLSAPDMGSTADEQVCHEGKLLAQLIQLLSQRPRHRMQVADLEVLLPQWLRQRADEKGGLAAWLKLYPSLFTVSGSPKEETIALILGGSQSNASVTPVKPVSQSQAKPSGGASTAAGGAAAGTLSAPAKSTGESKAADVVIPTGPWEPPSQTLRLCDVIPFSEETFQNARRGSDATKQWLPPGDGTCALQLRGLPFKASVEDIKTFLGAHAANLSADVQSIHQVRNRDGRPTGYAWLVMASLEAAQQCKDELHLKRMDDRYVEVFTYSDRATKMLRPRQREEGSLDDPAMAYLGAQDMDHAVADAANQTEPTASPRVAKENNPYSTPKNSATRGDAVHTPSDWNTPTDGLNLGAWGAGMYNPWMNPWGAAGLQTLPFPMPDFWASTQGWGAGPWADGSSADVSGKNGAGGKGYGSSGADGALKPLSLAAKEMSSTMVDFSSAVRLRGLPWSASEQDILAFFAQHDIVDRVADGPNAVHMFVRANGKASGQADVQLKDKADAEMAQSILHGQWMGTRYIEVFLYGEDGHPVTGATSAAVMGGLMPTPGLDFEGNAAMAEAAAATLKKATEIQAASLAASLAAYHEMPWAANGEYWNSGADESALETGFSGEDFAVPDWTAAMGLAQHEVG